MSTIIKFLWRSDDSGATAVEYAVMLAAILLAVIATVAAIGVKVGGMYSNSQSEMEAHGM